MRFFHAALAVAAVSAGSLHAHLKPGSLSIKGGETFTVGEKVTVTFVQSVGHNDGRFDFYFSKNGGSAWTEFAAKWPGPKGDNETITYVWTVPNSLTETGVWRACQLAGGECTDADYILKSGPFKIVAAGTSVLPGASASAASLDFAAGGVTAEFRLDVPGKVTLQAFDASGRVVATLLDGEKAAGSHRLSLFSNRLQQASGNVLLKLTFGAESLTRAITLP
jgi:hypothetical protein